VSAEVPTTHHAAHWAQILLEALDEALIHVEGLLAVFRLDDPTSALIAIMDF